MRDTLVGKLVGSRVRRVEDRRLLFGRGCYIDDIVVPGMAHATFLRSAYPHAVLRRIDVTTALRQPGVHAVLTGRDLQALTNPLLGLLVLDGLYDPWQWALAVDRVRFVGDPIAIVVAESRAAAEDAGELVVVDYEPLPTVASTAEAVGGLRPAIWPKAPNNLMYSSTEVHGDIDAAFAAADRVVKERFDQHRHSNQPLETRGSVAEVDPVTGKLTVHASHQSVHFLKWAIAFTTDRRPAWCLLRDAVRDPDQIRRVIAGARAFLHDNPTLLGDVRPLLPIMARQFRRDPGRMQHLLRGVLALVAKGPARLPQVEAGDIGGAFGAKSTVLREEVALCAAAMHLGRSIKWIEDRNEHLVAGAHARDESVEIEAAVRADGTILGIRAHLLMDAGAYPAIPYGAPMFARMIHTMLPGPYRVPAYQFKSTVAFTNKATYVAYRGPWAAETWVRERMLDVIARELGLSRQAVRDKNLFRPHDLPTTMITGPTLDVRMSARATFEQAMELAEVNEWQEVKAAALAEGRRLGLGFATYIEAAPGPPGYLDAVAPGFATLAGFEPAHAVLEADGTITIETAQVPHGQSHETTLTQVAADALGVPMEAIRVRYGNTRTSPFTLVGTGGSRSAAMAGGAVGAAAAGLRARIAEMAADLLEASSADVVIENGVVQVIGVPARGLSLAKVAAETRRRNIGPRGATPTRRQEALRVSSGWNGGEGGWAQSTHVCWVEVDLDTGKVRIPRYLVVEDCGEIINPAVVEGQIRGGVAQGVGAVLYEKIIYGDDGQIRTGTFMDYLLPTVGEIPPIEVHHVQTKSDIAYNFRGVGEGGMIGAPAAITNAIEDALADLGARITEQHLPPSRILELAGVIAPD